MIDLSDVPQHRGSETEVDESGDGIVAETYLNEYCPQETIVGDRFETRNRYLTDRKGKHASVATFYSFRLQTGSTTYDRCSQITSNETQWHLIAGLRPFQYHLVAGLREKQSSTQVRVLCKKAIQRRAQVASRKRNWALKIQSGQALLLLAPASLGSLRAALIPAPAAEPSVDDVLEAIRDNLSRFPE